MNHSEQESNELISQLRKFEAKLPPYDLPYIEKFDTPELWWGSIKTISNHLPKLAIRLFGIIPSQSNCERNFSTLKWIIGNHRTRLAVQKLEDISKIRSYCLTNMKTELLYHGKELTCSELRNLVNDSSIGTLMNVESEDDYLNNVNSNDDLIQERNTLIIGDIVDFNLFNNENHNEEHEQNNTNMDDPYNLDYDPQLLLDTFLENENNNL